MTIREQLQNGFLFYDGGMGSMLQAAGLPAGELPEKWNLTHPQAVINIHKEYYEAGADIVCANTFGANLFKFASEGEFSLSAVVEAAVNCECSTGADHRKIPSEQFFGENFCHIQRCGGCGVSKRVQGVRVQTLLCRDQEEV